jgi:predicted nucleotidyltransferase
MLIKPDTDKLQQIVEKYHLKLLVYYGSYARQEDYDPSRSDIDIAFISEGQLNSQQLFDLMSDLILLHRKSNIDLVNLQTASGLLKEAVVHEYKEINDEVVYNSINTCLQYYLEYMDLINQYLKC